MKKAFLLAVSLLSTVLACGSGTDGEDEQVGLGADTMLPKRTGTVVVDGCVLDTWSRSTLARATTKRVLSEVIMLCLVPREDGTIGPRDPSARAALAALAGELKAEGYKFLLGIAFTDESGQRYDGTQTRALLEKKEYRDTLVASLPDVIAPADGVVIDLQFLPNDARPFVTALVTEMSAAVKPQRRLDLFVPPSISFPSDLPGGDAFSRTQLAPFVDRMRIMTLDYSEQAAGPTIDPGWAVDAVRFAKSEFPRVDVSYPLYGTDFGPRGRRSITYHDARAIELVFRAPVGRGPTGAPFVRYVGFGGESHELWYDDAESTGRALGAWTYDVLPADVGVLFYGLGAEDPTLFERLAARTP